MNLAKLAKAKKLLNSKPKLVVKKKSLIGTDASKYTKTTQYNKLMPRYRSGWDIKKGVKNLGAKRKKKVNQAFSKPAYDLNS